MYSQNNMRYTQDFIARYMPKGTQSAHSPRTAMSELQSYIESLSQDEMQGLHLNEAIAIEKSMLLSGFLEYLLGHTQFGNEFCAGPGAALAQKLLDTVKSEHKAIAGKAQAETQDLKNLVMEQQKMMLEQKRQLDHLKNELGIKNES